MEPIKIDDKNRALILSYAQKRDAAETMLQQVIQVIMNVNGVNGDYKISPDASQLTPMEKAKKKK